MIRHLSYRCTKEDAGKKVGDFLKQKGYSHSLMVLLKKTENGIRLNGIWTYVSQTLREGDLLEVTIRDEEESQNIVPREYPLDIVYEDQDFLVINKPADMPVHPSINNFENTLANALAFYYQKKGEKFVFRCINRLDRDTTGLLIVAKHPLSGAIFSEMVKNRAIHREYLAIATGCVPEEGTIVAPIARKEESVIERCVDPLHGERAVTHYKRIAYKDGYSLVSLKLETGRTHQIRVHMKYIGHPLTGDFLYNPDYSICDHQALHSYRLIFSHPITGEKMEFVQIPTWDYF